MLAGSLVFLFILKLVTIQSNKELLVAENYSNINTIAYQDGDLILSFINLIVTAILSYLVYKVNFKLTEISVKEHSSKIKESSYQIFYCLNYNITSILEQIKQRVTIYNIRFQMKGDYINYIANLSNRLPDELIRELYDIFFDLAQVATEKNEDSVKRLFNRLFSSLENITKENYHEKFSLKFSLIYSEISEIINI